MLGPKGCKSGFVQFYSGICRIDEASSCSVVPLLYFETLEARDLKVLVLGADCLTGLRVVDQPHP